MAGLEKQRENKDSSPHFHRRTSEIISETPWPVTVVIPTLDCADSLRRHLASLKRWLHRVREVIVVDSHSTDGTWELLQTNLRHPQLRLLQRPRGLYASWNEGISQATSKWVYISTVGDRIRPKHLAHLLRCANRFQADVVISPPRMLNEKGKEMVLHWPIHEYLELPGKTQPHLVAREDFFIWNTMKSPCSLLGSSASNLYRTQTLQEKPFPTEFGNVGDTAWAITHGLELNVVITPQVGSEFWYHRPVNEIQGEKLQKLCRRLEQLARVRVSDYLANPEHHLQSKPVISLLQESWSTTEEYHLAVRNYEQAKSRLSELRKSRLMNFFKIKKLKKRKTAYKEEMKVLKQKLSTISPSLRLV